jgi:hypothetical protein
MHDLQNAPGTDPTEEIEPVISNRARALALDILHRVRPVCAHMPDEELLELATRMALVELYHFEQLGLQSSPRRRAANG